jgi:hypothetical protein
MARRARRTASPAGGLGARAAGWACACVLGLGLAGCEGSEGDTCEVATADVSAVALVVDSGWDIRAAIDFEAGDRRGRNSPLRLCDSDRLTINGDEPLVIEKADRIEYALSLPADGVRRFEFVLDRASEGDRIELQVELPPPFEILAPMAGAVIDPAQAQVIEWAPPLEGGAMAVEIGEEIGGGECLVATTPGHTYEAAGGVRVDDTGQWTIPAGALSSPSTLPCTLTYTLARVELARYPAALQASGRVEARTERYVDVEVP